MTQTARSRALRRGLLAGVVAAVAVLAVVSAPGPARARGGAVDPAALRRGPDPSVAYMVRDTIRDGDRRVPATSSGRHDGLWTTARGYVVRDHGRFRRGTTSRLVYVDRAGHRRLIGRSADWIATAVSPDRRRLVWERSVGRDGLRSVVTVVDPDTGRVLGSRRFRLVGVVAVTGSRVLLGRRVRWHHPVTTWWSYRRDSLTRVYHQAAVGADLRHDRVVFDRSSDGAFCNRVAPLSHPARTLWRSCRRYPHQWSPSGERALATHTYFDAAGTDRWLTVDGNTGRRLGLVRGRLDWDAVWEDDQHFLTLAQSDRGKAAIIRCTGRGRCERASRLWSVPLPESSVYYAPPPVVLSAN